MKLLLLLALLTTLHAEEILVWPGGAPGSEGNTAAEVVKKSDSGEITITQVHQPTITPYLPAKDKATGAAVIVAPGGGHRILCMTHEGSNVAEWLADHGIAAFVLKYRLASEEGSIYTVDDHAVADMHQAIRLIRSRAAEWNVKKLGVMGFSAGGEVCAIASMKFEAATRPDFQALIYPGRSQRIVPSKDSPPAFLAASSNDRPDISEGLTQVYLDFKKAGVPVELHLYAGGGHGFGVRPGKSAPVNQWIARFEEWLKEQKSVAK